MLPCLIKTPANAEEVPGKITKESFTCKGEQASLAFIPLDFTVPPAWLSQVLLVSCFLLLGVSSKRLKSFKPHPLSSNLIHPEKSFLTCSGQLQTCFPCFLGIPPCGTHKSDCQHLLLLSSYLRHPQHGLRGGERGTMAPSWPPGAWLVLHKGGATEIFLFFYKN